jgi:hypothetical protein
VDVKTETRQIVLDRVKRGIIDVAQRAGRLQTPMTQLLGTLDAHEALPRDVHALELFGMHGLWHTRDYLHRCRTLELYEIDPTYAAYAARTLPAADVVVADSIAAVKTGTLRRDTYNFIVSDNPFRAPYGKGYAEHFELFPDLLRYLDDGILILGFLPRRNDFTAEHARRRAEFYGKADPSIDDAAAVYCEHLGRAGLRSRMHFYTSRNRSLGYLTFVCGR